jgi:hypothetical protein
MLARWIKNLGGGRAALGIGISLAFEPCGVVFGCAGLLGAVGS